MGRRQEGGWSFFSFSCSRANATNLPPHPHPSPPHSSPSTTPTPSSPWSWQSSSTTPRRRGPSVTMATAVRLMDNMRSRRSTRPTSAATSLPSRRECRSTTSRGGRCSRAALARGRLGCSRGWSVVRAAAAAAAAEVAEVGEAAVTVRRGLDSTGGLGRTSRAFGGCGTALAEAEEQRGGAPPH